MIFQSIASGASWVALRVVIGCAILIGLCPAAHGEGTAVYADLLEISTPSPTPIRCAGDCDRDNEVSDEELQQCVQVFSGVVPDTCACDADGDGQVTTLDLAIITASRQNGCPGAPTRTPTAPVAPTPTSTPIRCAGDCDGDNEVSEEEEQQCIQVYAGVASDTCNVCDTDGDGQVTGLDIAIIRANRQNGCPGAPTRTPTPTPPCPGDCNGNRQVSVEELVRIVNVALGIARFVDCSNGDLDRDGQITVDEVVTAVARSLTGCGLP